MQDPSRPATGYPAPPYFQPNGGQAPPSGAAYPYAAPPPYPQPQYYNPNSSRTRFTRSFVRTFFATIICLFVIFGTIVFITWLVLRPTLPRVRLESLSLSNLSANGQSLSGTWQAGFLVRNENKKMSITYQVIRSSIFYKSTYLSEAQLPPFKQETKNETALNATFSAVNTYVEKRIVDDMNGDKARGSIPFDVQVLASTSFRSGAWRLRTRVLKVLCRNALIGISSNGGTSGRLSGGAKDCQVWT
ncbi:NDR1/HIN1-like protein 10 [Senna tora]|uniref:NDR1/HIN1-like protein 10 n=1 Tax=Senna tora TaxID=362788 RepID=A0A834W1L2_9FABA|nr:NDR1/HIN1-like protein 10 [Senna tora]